MSIIYSYPDETSLQGSDMLIGTSTALVGGKQKNITKNFTLDQLTSFIQGGGGVINPAASDFQIAVFNQSGKKLTGSIMSQDVYPSGTGITVSGNLSTTGNLVAPGTVTLGSGSNLINLTSTTKFSGVAQDANGTQGTLNQILLSDTNGKLVWGNYTAGLTYQGLWNASTNSPGLSSSVGVNSTFYIVGTAGNTVLNGNTDWQVGDWAIFVGTTGAGGIWQKIDNTSSITGNGTLNRMVMWSSNFTVTDGPLLDSSGTNVLSILDRSIIPSVSNTRSLGSSSLKWNMLYVNDIETTNINILSHVDLNSLPGTPGQVLTSSGAGAPAVWTTPTTGTITGAGTTNKIPLWTNSTIIGTSILTQLNAAGFFTNTYLSVDSGGISTPALKVDGFLLDSTGSKGAAGQILSSTGTATLWKTGDDEGVTYTLSAGAQDGTSVPINLIDSLSVTTPVKLTGGTNVDVVRTSATEITLSSTDTNTTYDFGSSTSGSDVLLNLVGTPADNSFVKLIGSGVTITQTNDEVTFTVPAGDTYDLGSGASAVSNSIELQLTSGSGTDNSAVTLTGGTGITVEQTGDVVTLTGVAQGITGSGTIGKLPKFDTTTSLTDSIISETVGGIAIAGELDMSNNKIVNVTNPTNTQDAATKDYVDAIPTGVMTFGTSDSGATITVSGSASDPRVEANTTGGVGAGSTSLATGAQIQTAITNSAANYLPLAGGTMTGAIALPGNPTLALEAATKSYVDNTLAGSGSLIFQGPYDAANNSPDLTTSPNSILKGWTYAVTAGPSTSFWSPPLNVGDLVIANIDNPTSVADWTEVQSNVGFAGSGATDGATVKGIAGFNSADFDVSNDGWVEAKDFTGTTPGYVPDATGATAGTFLKEDGTWSTIAPTAGVGSYTTGNGTILSPQTTSVQLAISATSASGSVFTFLNGLSLGDLVQITDGTVNGFFTYAAAGGGPNGYRFAYVSGEIPTNFSTNANAINLRNASAGVIGDISGSGNGSSVTYFTGVVGDTGVKEITSNPNIVIDATGKFGIGTSSPSYKLSLRDDSTSAYPLSLENNNIGTAGTHTGIRFGYAGNTYQKGAIIFESQDANGRGKMYFAMEGTANSSNADEADAKMTIDYTGNVGIGTTSPGHKLQVNDGDIAITGGLSSSLFMNTTTNQLYGDVNGVVNLKANDNLRLNTNSAERVRVISNGNVGIGTSSPGAKLQVTNGSTGQAYSNVEGILIDTNGNSNSDYSLRIGSSAGNDNLVVTTSGRVGIRTDSPEVSLDLGNNTDAIRVPNGPTADRPSGILPGMIRYNTSTNEFEGYSGTLNVSGSWGALGGGVSSVLPSSTGLISSGQPLVITPAGGTGTVTIESTAYGGGPNVGHVPGGGMGGQYLDGGTGGWSNLPAGYTSWTASSDQLTNITVTDTTNLPFTGRLASDGAYASIPNESGIYTDTAINTGEVTIGLINNGGTPSATTFYRGDGQWATPSGASATITSNQTITTNATTTVFALGATPNGSSVNFVDAFIDGVYQETTTYSVSGQNLTFNSPIPSGVTVETKTTSDYNVGAAVQTVSLGQSNETGNVNLRIAPVEVLSATTPTAAANHLYIFTATSGTPSTLTLPSNPVSGDSIKISNIGGLANVITPSGTDKIMGVAGSMTINNPTAAFEMIWSGITAQGWVIIGNV